MMLTLKLGIGPIPFDTITPIVHIRPVPSRISSFQVSLLLWRIWRSIYEIHLITTSLMIA